MHVLVSAPAMWLQSADVAVASTSDAHLTMIFTGVIAVCIFLVVLALLGTVVALLTLRKKLVDMVADTTKKATPLIAEATSLFNEVSPNVRKISANFSSISETVKSKVDQFDGTLTDVNARTKHQVARVDGMVSDALTTTSDIASTIHRGIRAPIREVAGVVAAVKAGFDVLLGKDFDASVRDASHTAASVTPISPRPEPVPPAAASGRAQGV